MGIAVFSFDLNDGKLGSMLHIAHEITGKKKKNK